MTGVPSNLIPTTITRLPEYNGTDPLGFLPYSFEGRTYKIQLNVVLNMAFVPSTRTVTAGNGLLGGGSLASDITLSVSYYGATPNAGGVASAGTSFQLSRGDHVHPAVTLNNLTETTGLLPVTRGGTGSALSPTAGAIAYADGTNIVLLAPSTAGFVLTTNGPGVAPSWTLPASGGGTVTSVAASGGTTGMSFTGSPITTSGTFTLTGTLATANGGTGQSSYAVGDLLYASTTTALSKLADVATGNALISGGVGVAPSYGKIGLTTHISGTLAVGNGGTGATTLTGYLSGNGTGAFTASATIPGADISGNISGNAANVTGTVAAANGGTGQTVYAVGDILYASTTTALSKLADVATGNALISGGVGVAPSYGKIGLTTHISGTLAVGNGGTGATSLTGVVIGNGAGAFTTVAAPTGAIVGTTDTQTLTATRINPRVSTNTSVASPTPNADTDDQYQLTALAAAAAFQIPSGTPVNGQKLMIRIKDNGTARALSYNAIYRALGVTLPTTTVINKTLYLGMIYNSADTKWDVVAVAQEA